MKKRPYILYMKYNIEKNDGAKKDLISAAKIIFEYLPVVECDLFRQGFSGKDFSISSVIPGLRAA